MDRFLQLFDLPRSIIARDDNARSHRNSIKKSNKQKNQAAGRAHRRQGIAPQEVPDDQRICRIIELLKKISEKKRQCKRHHFFPYASFCQKRLGLCIIHTPLPPFLP